MHKKLHDMAAFIEFIAGSGLAIFFHLVLHRADAAYIVFGVGILFSLGTYLLREDLAQTQSKLITHYDQAHEITFAISRMADTECRDKAHEILAGVLRTLALLQQGYVPLDETEFYLNGTRYFDESSRQIKTVDPATSGWDSRGSLLNYYQANLRALERGVRVTRIFVLNREDLAIPEVQKVLLTHLRDGIEVRVAYRDELPTANDIVCRDTASSFDFAIYDDMVATEVFSQPGKYFGRKTRDTSLVAHYQHLFALIEHVSHPTAIEGECVALSTESHCPDGETLAGGGAKLG